jgi:hypothetical protein
LRGLRPPGRGFRAFSAMARRLASEVRLPMIRIAALRISDSCFVNFFFVVFFDSL